MLEDTAAKRHEDRDTASEVQGGNVDIKDDPLEENLLVDVSENLSHKDILWLVMSEILGIIFIEMWLAIGEGLCPGKSLLHVKLSLIKFLCQKAYRLSRENSVA